MLKTMDEHHASTDRVFNATSNAPLFYDLNGLIQLKGAQPGSCERSRDLLSALLAGADAALSRGPYSVVHKSELPPSKDPHDYYHPAPYFWPRKYFGAWLPAKRRDGQRIPGTRLYDAESDRYDRTRLQRMFDDTTVLALAWCSSGKVKYLRHAIQLIDCWFIAPATRMNPNLNFAQVRMGRDGKRGRKSGVIEFKDIYFLLDAVQLVRSTDLWSEPLERGFSEWLESYLEWLLTSDQGVAEAESKNNHGTCYDLQVAAIANFLGRMDVLNRVWQRLPQRMSEQFDAHGFQRLEAERTLTQHYFCFNLQSWVHLAMLSDAHGVNIWNGQGDLSAGLERPLRYFLETRGRHWSLPQIEAFDVARYDPLALAYNLHCQSDREYPLSQPIRPLFFPHDGVRPFWLLSPGAPPLPMYP